MQETVRIDDERVRRALKWLGQELKDPKPALRDIGEIIFWSVGANFAAAGRPDKWPESLRVKKHGGQTLSDKARLRRSISVRVSSNAVQVGTNVKYAAIHQLGGDIKHPARSRVLHFKTYKSGAKKGRTLFSKPGRASHAIVGEAKSGLEAIELYKTLRPEVVSMDITMREMDGFAAAKKILGHDAKAKIIFISNLDAEKYGGDAKRIGAVGFVNKHDTKDFLALLESV